jgi:hypothetical protein
MTSNPKPTPAKPAAPAAKPSFGFNDFSELLNGRMAMIGFVAMVVIEYSTHQTLASLAGISL